MSAFFSASMFALVIPDAPSLSDTLMYQLTGLLVVLSALAFLALAIKFAGMLFSLHGEPRDTLAPKPGSAPAAAPVADASGGRVPPEILAVIAAAVDTVLQGRGRILSIHEHPHSDHTHLDPKLLAWSMEGRRQIFSSHQVR